MYVQIFTFLHKTWNSVCAIFPMLCNFFDILNNLKRCCLIRKQISSCMYRFSHFVQFFQCCAIFLCAHTVFHIFGCKTKQLFWIAHARQIDKAIQNIIVVLLCIFTCIQIFTFFHKTQKKVLEVLHLLCNFFAHNHTIFQILGCKTEQFLMA